MSANHTTKVGITSLKPVNGLTTTPARPKLRAQPPYTLTPTMPKMPVVVDASCAALGKKPALWHNEKAAGGRF